MKISISHSRRDETIEEKVRWFRSLKLEERMEMLCSFTEIALSVNPGLQDKKDPQPVKGRIQVVTKR